MLRARLSNGTFLMGIDAENVERLRKGQPLIINLGPMGGTDTVLIVYGETLDDIARQIENATGQKLPPAQPWPGDNQGEH